MKGRVHSFFTCVLLTFFGLLTNSHSLALSRNQDAPPWSAELLSRYIMHNSVTGSERSAGLFFSTVARQNGLYVEILTDEPDSFNFTASLYPLDQGKPNIIFLNHIDVVPATENEHYTFPPFSGAIYDGMVWGRGAIDNKGMGVMQLVALAEYADRARTLDLPYNITMLSVSGEETGGFTGASLISDYYIDYLNPVVVYGEGGAGIPGILTSDPDRKVFGISVIFKRCIWIELTLRMNTSGHGSVTPESYVAKDMVNSLNQIVDKRKKVIFDDTTRQMFRELGKMEGGLKGFALRNLWLFKPLAVPAMKKEDMVYSLITNTVTVTGINTPEGPVNQIPQEIEVVLDCRILPDIETDQFVSELIEIIDNDNVELNVFYESVMANPTEPDEYYDMMSDAIKTVFPGSGVLSIMAPAASDNNFFRKHDIPTYGILPVFLPVNLLESIHNVDERIPIDALEDGVNVYRELISILLDIDR